MTAPAALVRLAEPWANLYSDSKVLQTIVVFLHIAALVFAGGFAITLDRFTLRAFRGSAELRARQLDELATSHRLVVGGLALSALTGLLLFAADLETFFTSLVFWTKMGLVVLLLLNGFGITKLEAQVRATAGTADAAWRGLRRAAITSLVLWFGIAFLGVVLVNI